MKKLIYCAAALATALFAGSCQRELLDPAQDGSTVTFTVNVPEAATKAIGNAENVNNLVYAVYRVTGETEGDAKKGLTPEKLVYQDHNSVVNGKSTVTLELINDQAYVVVFWAQVANTWFDNDYQFGTKTVTYPTGLVANDDKYSAFYGVSYIDDVKGPNTKDITLHRPFAQINIATKDPEKYNVAINNTYVSVANAASAFDVAKEEAVVTENYSVSFKAAPMPANETLTVNGVEYKTGVKNTGSKENDVHHYIAMNYVFAAGNVDVTYAIDTDYGVVRNTITNVPVAKNYRTNIVGNLLTSDVKYNVELDTDWAGQDKNGLYVFDAKQLKEAINSITATSSPVIYFADDIKGDVTVVQKPGVKITIDGNKMKYDGSIKVHGNSEHYADAALTIKNVNFETGSTYIGQDGKTPCFNFIEALENGSERYSANITVESCTFTATKGSPAENLAVGLQIKSSKWAKVLNCTATNMHSLIQAQSCDETVVVKDCEVTGKNGVAFKQVKSATVEGCTITAKGDTTDGSVGYGIRFDGNTNNYGITIKDNNITAAQPVIVRKMTGKDNTITLEGKNTLNTDANYQIIITNGSDDKPYEKPTGTYNLDGEEKFYIYEGQSVAKVGTTEYSTIDEAISNWANGTTLTLLANVRLRNVIEISST